MLKIPYLIIHGDEDKAVKINEGYDLHSWNKNNKLIIIKNGGHTFGSKHPWEENIFT
jgi:pimeloyl-ACP methyl ester carboxylesterase